MFKRIQRRLTRLAELGCLQIDDVEPCTEQDLVALETKLGFGLPGVLRDLYQWGGNDLGSVFGAGMDVLSLKQHMEHDYRPGAREELQAAKEDSSVLDDQTFILQMDCDGQFAFVRADQGDDPPVYNHNEQEPLFCSAARVSDYLALMVEQAADVEEIELVRSLERLKRLAELLAHRVQHVHFSGEMQFATFPEDVFALGELRSINAVGKGLLELSPRVAELAFVRKLDLAKNSLSSLPMALAQLDELEELDLADNQLGTVIGVLGKMPALRYCWLAGNPIAAEEVNQLRHKLRDATIDF
jgi:hypothetical protein